MRKYVWRDLFSFLRPSSSILTKPFNVCGKNQKDFYVFIGNALNQCLYLQSLPCLILVPGQLRFQVDLARSP